MSSTVTAALHLPSCHLTVSGVDGDTRACPWEGVMVAVLGARCIHTEQAAAPESLWVLRLAWLKWHRASLHSLKIPALWWQPTRLSFDKPVHREVFLWSSLAKFSVLLTRKQGIRFQICNSMLDFLSLAQVLPWVPRSRSRSSCPSSCIPRNNQQWPAFHYTGTRENLS